MRIKSLFCSALVATGLTFCLSPYPALAFVTVSVTPTEQAVAGGSTAVFNAQVSTTGGETITGYSWQMSTNGLSPFNPVPGATTATCTLTNVQPASDGYYFVRVTYNAGQVSVSEAVRLIVQDQARIATQPQSLIRSTAVPTNAVFSVGALGSAPLSYRWRFNGANLTDSPPRITGAATATLTLTNLTTADSGSYTVVVTNAVAAVTSQVATLAVCIPVGIAAQPLDRGFVVGSNATFSVTPSGTAPFSYGWQKDGTNLSNGGQISGATSNILTIAAVTTNNEGSYSVIVTNPVGSVASSNALLTVLFPAAFTSPTNAVGRQGGVFDFTNTATGTIPIYFGATNLPLGLSIEPTNGVISGTPTVTGLFNVTLFATNAAMTTTGKLAITLTTGTPGYYQPPQRHSAGRDRPSTTPSPPAIDPAVFSASGVPSGLSFNATSGVISGVPLIDGVFPIPLGVTNQYGGDSELLTLNLASALPVITSSSTAFWAENQSGFRYTIRASNTPTEFGASDLPLGLSVNTTNGVISGTPVCGGTFIVPIWAINAWGTGSTNLTLIVNYAPLGGLAIIDVIPNYHSPYLLDFSFSLVDGSDPTSVEPVVRDPSQLQVICREDGEPISSATAFVVEKGNKKQLRSFVVLDYTYSMYAAPGAIDAMETAAKTFINYEPAHALFGIYEFHADICKPEPGHRVHRRQGPLEPVHRRHRDQLREGQLRRQPLLGCHLRRARPIRHQQR